MQNAKTFYEYICSRVAVVHLVQCKYAKVFFIKLLYFVRLPFHLRSRHGLVVMQRNVGRREVNTGQNNVGNEIQPPQLMKGGAKPVRKCYVVATQIPPINFSSYGERAIVNSCYFIVNVVINAY